MKRARIHPVCWLLSCVCSLLVSHGAEPAKPSATAPPAAQPPLKKIDDAVFEIGKVRFNKANQTITIPATVNMDQGPIEYVLVHSTGKVHESLLRTEAEPYHIHLAFLLLSGKSSNPSKPIQNDPREASRKQNVLISILSTKDGKETSVHAEDFVFNLQTKQPMSPGPWSYVGSRLIDGTFLAQRDGSVVAIIDDADALINNPRPGSENDEIWQVNSAGLPPVGTSVQVAIRLEEHKQP